MNKYIFLSGVACLGLSLPSFAGEMVDKSVSAERIQSVSIENIRGRVDIIAHNEQSISIKGELDDETERFVFEPSGRNMEIRVELPQNHRGKWEGDGSNLTIKVPKHIRIAFQGVSSDFSLSGFEDRVDGRTVSGNIVAKDLAKKVELESVSGDVTTENLSGKLQLATVSGDIKDKHSQGRMKLKTVSGDIQTQSTATEVAISAVSGAIDFDLDKVDELAIKSVSGSISGQSHLNNGGRIKIGAVSSNIDLALQENLSAAFKVSASAGGHIVNELTDHKPHKAKYGPSSKLKFTTGNADSAVKIGVVSGKVTLRNK